MDYISVVQYSLFFMFIGIGFGALLGIICLSVIGAINIFDKVIK